MIKIFTTQLFGLLKDMQKREELMLEDAARLLSQALVGEGNVYLFGKNEMEAVTAEALAGKERFAQFHSLIQDDKVVPLRATDRVLLITRSSADEEVLVYAKELAHKQIPFVVISSIDEKDKRLAELADVHLDLNVTTGLVPTDSGERIGYPASLVALYTYFCLHCLITEILAEYD